MDTIKCPHCGFHINVATGTFGSGIPEKCFECDKTVGGWKNWVYVGSGWGAEDLNEKLSTPDP